MAETKTVVELGYTIYRGTNNYNDSNYYDDQQGGGPVVLFLHGLLGNRRNFATIATALAQSDLLQRQRQQRQGGTRTTTTTIYTLDLRNHGTSVPWQEDMSYSSMAADVVAFLDRHGYHQDNENYCDVTLVGHSMGGKVAQAVALLYPERVQGLVILDMAPVSYDPSRDSHWKAVCDIVDLLVQLEQDQRKQQHQQQQSDGAAPTNKRTLDQALRRGIPDPALRAFCLTNWDDVQKKWKVNLNAIQNQLHVLAGFGETNHYVNTNNSSVSSIFHGRQFEGDVLLVHGGQSRFVRHTHLPIIQSYFPNHMITTVRGAGHWLHAEKPQDIISLLEQYLNR